MDDTLLRARLKRFWILFTIVWLLVFGFMERQAASAAEEARNATKRANAAEFIYEGVLREQMSAEDAAAIERKNAERTRTEEAHEAAIAWLFLGWLGGTLLIWFGGPWVINGRPTHDENPAQ